jgi:hypothetical protein
LLDNFIFPKGENYSGVVSCSIEEKRALERLLDLYCEQQIIILKYHQLINYDVIKKEAIKEKIAEMQKIQKETDNTLVFNTYQYYIDAYEKLLKGD